MIPMPSRRPDDCAGTEPNCRRVAGARGLPRTIAALAWSLALVWILSATGCGDDATPEQARTAYDRGVANAQAGRLEAALRDLEAALEIDASQAETHILYAVLQERKDELETAERHLQRALEIDAQDPDAPLHLARVRRKRALDQKIDAARKQIVSAAPTRERLVAFGDLLRERERFEPAQVHYLWAQRIAAPNAASHTGLGLVYSRTQRQVRALYHLSEALRMDPASALARDEIVWILATSSHEDLSDPAEAVRLGEAALADERPPSSRLLDALAAAYAATGRFEEARALAGKAAAAAEAAQDHLRAHQIRERLRIYEAGRRFVGPPVDAG